VVPEFNSRFRFAVAPFLDDVHGIEEAVAEIGRSVTAAGRIVL
jgi:hypothetical protein